MDFRAWGRESRKEDPPVRMLRKQGPGGFTGQSSLHLPSARLALGPGRLEVANCDLKDVTRFNLLLAERGDNRLDDA